MDLASKHHELSSSFRCYTIEAAMEFSHMDNIADTPTNNRPNYAFMITAEQKQNYFQETFDRFTGDADANQSEPRSAGAHTDHASAVVVDNLRSYRRNFLQYFLRCRTIWMLLKKEMGKGWPKSIKIFFYISKKDRSFNAYAIEMMVNIAQNEVLLC